MGRIQRKLTMRAETSPKNGLYRNRKSTCLTSASPDFAFQAAFVRKNGCQGKCFNLSMTIGAWLIYVWRLFRGEWTEDSIKDALVSKSQIRAAKTQTKF